MTQQLWQASKLATMGELAASIASLNNPLATLALRAETLVKQLGTDHPQRKSIDVISQEVDRMAKLVSNLLQFSRRHHQQVSTLDLPEELTYSLEFIDYYLRSRKVTVVKEFSPQLPSIQGERQQLRQVFLNLLTNAADAMPEGGTLTIRARPGNAVPGDSVVVEFADTGIGIDLDDLAKVWEPFFTTKSEEKGTGLGLAICRRTIEEHRGKVQIESLRGVGTTVRLVLPATANGVIVESELK